MIPDIKNILTPFQIRSIIKRFIARIFHSCYENVSADIARQEIKKQIEEALESMNNYNW